MATIVTPDTIMRWHRRLIAAEWTHPSKRVGRPGIMKAIPELIVRMATDNAGWGLQPNPRRLKKLDHRIARSTIANTLRDHGIRPSPERPTSWRTFFSAHTDVIAATDFFTVEVWTARGLVTHYVLFVIEHATRAGHIAGVTTNPNAEFMAQVARNLTTQDDGFLRDKRYLILDADTKFAAQFRRIIEDAGVTIVQIAYQAPNMNAIAERWVKSVKTECLDQLILLGQGNLECALREYVTYYHTERPHQSLGNAPIHDTPCTGTGDVVDHERLGGLLRSYSRAALRPWSSRQPRNWVTSSATGLPSPTELGTARSSATCHQHLDSRRPYCWTARARLAVAKHRNKRPTAAAARPNNNGPSGHVPPVPGIGGRQRAPPMPQ